MIDREQIENWHLAPESASPYGADNGPLHDPVPVLHRITGRRADWVILDELAEGLAPNAPLVIGLTGPAGSGKSTVAAILAKYGYTRLRFADGLKTMLRALLAEAGLHIAEINRMIEGGLKEAPHPALGGRSPRHAMQTLGTEWGRTYLGLDYWADLTWRRIAAILAQGGRVVVEDVRFLNEAAVITGPEGDHMRGLREVWRLEGRGGIAGGHVSERGAAGVQADLVLDNSGDPEALAAQVLEAILG